MLYWLQKNLGVCCQELVDIFAFSFAYLPSIYLKYSASSRKDFLLPIHIAEG